MQLMRDLLHRSTSRISEKKLLILDFDNTLFDWVKLWHSCFVAMTDEVERISKIGLADIQDEIRAIHQTHGTSEYAFLLEEVPTLRRFLDGRQARDVFQPAITAFRNQRRQLLKLYPSVAETLLTVRASVRGLRSIQNH